MMLIGCSTIVRNGFVDLPPAQQGRNAAHRVQQGSSQPVDERRISTMRKRTYATAFIGASLFVVTVASIRSWRDNNIPVQIPNANLPNPNETGDIRAALVQTKKLVDFLRANGEDPHRVPDELGILPDAKNADNEFLREENRLSFSFPGASPSANNPAKEKILVVSEVYYRRNPAYYKGDIGRFKPEGFIIVGWRDGRVEAVPAKDVRVVKIENGNRYTRVYPGMKEWKADGIRIVEFEYADGKEARPEAKAFYDSLSGSECTTCTTKSKS
jgi:hypothetical protein